MNAKAAINAPIEASMIQLNKIIINPKLNARKIRDKESFEALRDSMKASGLEVPIKVSSPDDRGMHTLVYGFNRYDAAKELEWKEIAAIIAPPTATMTDHKWSNLEENCNRQDLLPWELGERCLEIQKESKASGAEMAKRLGKSKGYINSLIQCVNGGLHPTILNAWKKNAGITTTMFLFKLVAIKDQAEQLVQWEKAMGGSPENGEDDGGDGNGSNDGDPKPKRASAKALEALVKLARSRKMQTMYGKEFVKGVLACANFALGVGTNPLDSEDEEGAAA